jgi:probable HAF family extracellular repeat protein
MKRLSYRRAIGVLLMLWVLQYPASIHAQSALLYWLGAPIGGRSVATDVSNTGIVVGYVQTSSGTHYAFYWRSDTRLQTLNQSASGAEAVEDGIHGGRFMMVGWLGCTTTI